MHELRIRLLEQLCRLPERELPTVESFLAKLASAAPAVESIEPKNWPHAPTHRLSEHGTYIITASTLNKAHRFQGPDRLDLLETKLMALARQFDVSLEAWAVFSNHYHFVAHTTGVKNQLKDLVTRLHELTAIKINQIDGSLHQPVWFNYWDTKLTFEKSYLARLNYVHQNAVKHGLVTRASDYRWCSAGWFERTATPAQVRTIYGFRLIG